MTTSEAQTDNVNITVRGATSGTGGKSGKGNSNLDKFKSELHGQD
jgi:hypothetical protein